MTLYFLGFVVFPLSDADILGNRTKGWSGHYRTARQSGRVLTTCESSTDLQSTRYASRDHAMPLEVFGIDQYSLV